MKIKLILLRYYDGVIHEKENSYRKFSSFNIDTINNFSSWIF